MTETQQRFLRAIAERLSAERVVELHVFPSIRQGGSESGVAVLAVEDPALSPSADEIAEPAAPVVVARRLAVYAARYRLTLKGPDRGKWECDVVAEADAPLVTVDAVVRGVQRRAGEIGDAERLSGDAFRAALAEPAWTSDA